MISPTCVRSMLSVNGTIKRLCFQVWYQKQIHICAHMALNIHKNPTVCLLYHFGFS